MDTAEGSNQTLSDTHTKEKSVKLRAKGTSLKNGRAMIMVGGRFFHTSWLPGLPQSPREAGAKTPFLFLFFLFVFFVQSLFFPFSRTMT